MVVLFFADIFGKPGRKAVAASLGDLQATYSPDIIIGNVENLAGGRGVNRRTFQELVDMGFHGFTSGNHIWDNKDVYQIMETDERLIRPANYPDLPGAPCPGRGFSIIRGNGKSLFVINLLGRVFMDALDDPFKKVDEILAQNPTPHPILVDMHCDATSEKYAMGWHLAGRVSAMVGSHSHVQTADERILPGGTAYITDVGMSGAFDSVIGMRPAEVINKFLTKRHSRYEQARDNPGISCVVIRIGIRNRAESIERIRRTVDIRVDGGDLE